MADQSYFLKLSTHIIEAFDWSVVFFIKKDRIIEAFDDIINIQLKT